MREILFRGKKKTTENGHMAIYVRFCPGANASLILSFLKRNVRQVALSFLKQSGNPPARSTRTAKPPKREPEHKEPTILWTVGNLCMWKGKLCEIERFDTTSNNQTVVHLRREGLGYGLCVPIEELEAVEE